jgi:hypothetical protein
MKGKQKRQKGARKGKKPGISGFLPFLAPFCLFCFHLDFLLSRGGLLFINQLN